MNTAFNTCLRLNYPSWSRPRSHWSATDPRNQQTTFRAKTHQHTTKTCTACCLCYTCQTDGLHRSDRWPAPTRPVDSPVATAAAQQMFQGASVTPQALEYKHPQNSTCKEEESFTKPSKATPNCPRTQQQHNPKTHEPRNSPETNPTKGSHRSDRSRAPVKDRNGEPDRGE
jgi:hypothetical protein